MPIIGVIASSIAKSSAENSATIFLRYNGLGYTTTNGTTWTSFNTTPFATDQTYVQSIGGANNNAFVYAYGGVTISTNGTTYSPSGGNFTASNYAGLKYLNGAYWGTNSNVVATSTDGISWTFPTVGRYSSWNDIAYGNGTYVAAGNDGSTSYVYTSTDGTTWTSRTAPAMNIQSLIYATRFVGVGYDQTGSNGGRTVHSTDGITWSAVNQTGLQNPSGWIYQIAYGNGRYVTPAYNSTNCNTSTDGITWTTRAMNPSPSETNWSAIVYGDRFVMGTNGSPTNGMLMTSTDGITWTQRSFGVTTPGYQLAYAHSRYYLRTGTWSGGAGSQSMVLTSTDTVTWTAWAGGRFGNWIGGSNMVKFQNTYYVTTEYPSNGWLYFSTNGQTWSTRTILSPFAGTASFYNLFASSSLFLAATDQGSLASSTDGITWTSRTNPYPGDSIYSFSSDTTITNKYLMTMQSGKIATSTDGATWTGQTVGSTTWVGSTRAFGLYMIAGSVGALRTSTDAVTWTTRTTGLNQQIGAFATNGTILLVGGTNGNLASSTDGITWTSRTTGLVGQIYRIKWTTFGFITSIVGTNANTQYSQYATSTDGITWTSRSFTGIQGGGEAIVVI